jgi:hypothetical protein
MHEQNLESALIRMRRNGEIDPAMLDRDQCIFCFRIMQNGITEHHLIPRRCHRNRWFQKNFSRAEMQTTVPACRDCHNAIHRFVPKEKELGKHFNKVELLLARNDFSRFVEWAKKQK